MRSLVINITDVGADYHVDDEVLLWTPKVRGSSEDPDRLISTAPRRVPLTRGRATVEVEPGTLLVQFRCRGFADVEPRKIVVPAGNGEVTLRSLFDASEPLDPPVITILNEVQKYVEFYDVDGVFLDEMVNGWSEQQTALIPFYRDLYHELKSLYGEKFLIVGNPGTVTKTDLLECADMLMTFENSAANYLSADDSNIAPHPYTLYPPHRFIHVVHDVKTRDQAGKVLARMDRSNVANVFLTTDTYDGGVVSPTNNPWDNLPAGWLMDLQMAWARRQPLPTAGA